MYRKENVVGGVSYQSEKTLQNYNTNFYYFEDPFAAFLEAISRPNFLNFVNIESVSMFLFEFPLGKSFIFPLKKDMQGLQPVDKILA